ncbi:MAG TPA: ArsB/NhaD family transporter [Propionibacteriaceae bacterium]|nr:ArsB/NhaD family transporter [Propionibacteriaceae bacterium]
MTWVILGIFLAAYALIASERIPRTHAALGGAAAMVLVGGANATSAFFHEDTAIDWNVIFLLLGMMIIVSVLKQTGLFEFVAIWAAKRSGGRPFLLMTLLILITAIASAVLDNVTTVLLIAPVTLLVCDRLGTSPVPFLLSEVMASNIGGTATLVGDPPNIIIASRGGLTFNQFLVHMTPIAVVLVGVFVGLAWLLWGRHLVVDADLVERVMDLDEREAIHDRPLLLKSLGCLALALLGFVLQGVTGIEPSLVALIAAGVLVVVSGLEPADYLEEVEWGTLVFFMGLFVMVGGLVKSGLIAEVGGALVRDLGDHRFIGATALLWLSGLLSAVVDNIPYVATMAPLVNDLVVAQHGQPLWWALALGADLGGNATAIGASANVVVLGIAARNKHPISFWGFTKYGLVVAAATLLVSWCYWLLRYL